MYFEWFLFNHINQFILVLMFYDIILSIKMKFKV